VHFPHIVTSLPQQWDACQQTLEGHTDSVDSVVFSSDGSQVASASDDHTVRLWDAKTGACQQTLEGHTDWVRSVVFSSDGSQVASASYDQTVRLWDAKTGEALFVQKCSTFVPEVQFDANGTYIWVDGERIAPSATSEARPELDAENPERTVEPTKRSSLRTPEMTSTLTVDDSGEWVLYMGQRYLWIPKTYRGVWKAHGKVLVCGSPLGRMSFIFEHKVDVAPPAAPAVAECATIDPEDDPPWMLMSRDQPALYHPFL
jgi:hypothetical protein